MGIKRVMLPVKNASSDASADRGILSGDETPEEFAKMARRVVEPGREADDRDSAGYCNISGCLDEAD